MHARIHVIDSHTEGEPTRVVVSGGPDLLAHSPTAPGSARGPTVADQLRVFRERFDDFRAAVANEPRGSEPLVGALLCPPAPSASNAPVTGVIFFNNVGFLGGCGHGTIGVARTLRHLGRIGPGRHFFETPVGNVAVTLARDPAAPIAIENVPSYRLAAGVELELDRPSADATAPSWEPWMPRRVRGDIAWGGNWFFLCDDHSQSLELAHADRLSRLCWVIRTTLTSRGFRGADGSTIDHVELFGPAARPDCHSRNYVHCPGGAYDRSPCGTGTSAKLACLCAAGKLRPGETWRQESIIGSVFEARYTLCEPDAPATSVTSPRVVPTIAGNAWIISESVLLVDPTDPFRHGIRT